jgi:hypothetical protein
MATPGQVRGMGARRPDFRGPFTAQSAPDAPLMPVRPTRATTRFAASRTAATVGVALT